MVIFGMANIFDTHDEFETLHHLFSVRLSHMPQYLFALSWTSGMGLGRSEPHLVSSRLQTALNGVVEVRLIASMEDITVLCSNTTIVSFNLTLAT